MFQCICREDVKDIVFRHLEQFLESSRELNEVDFNADSEPETCESLLVSYV